MAAIFLERFRPGASAADGEPRGEGGDTATEIEAEAPGQHLAGGVTPTRPFQPPGLSPLSQRSHDELHYRPFVSVFRLHSLAPSCITSLCSTATTRQRICGQ